MALKIAERLQARLASTGLIVDVPKRQYTGHWQRSEGAWSWSALVTDQYYEVGSPHTMRECLKMSDEDFAQAVE